VALPPPTLCRADGWKARLFWNFRVLDADCFGLSDGVNTPPLTRSLAAHTVIESPVGQLNLKENC